MTARPFPFTFDCQRTGNCCARPGGVVRVTAADIVALAAHTGLENAAFRARFVAPSGDRLREGLGPGCVFLRDGPHPECSVYPARPEQCRTWPFWDELRDPATLAAAKRFCPGIRPLDD